MKTKHCPSGEDSKGTTNEALVPTTLGFEAKGFPENPIPLNFKEYRLKIEWPEYYVLRYIP